MTESTTSVPTPPDATADATVAGLRNNPVSFVTGLHRSFGDMIRVPLGTTDLFLTSDPAAIRDMFITFPDVFKKRQDEETEKVYLVSIGGLVPFFEADRIASYGADIVATATNAHTRWSAAVASGAPTVDMYREMMQTTVEVVARTLFHQDAVSSAAEVVSHLLELNVGYGFDPIEANLGPLLPPGVAAPTEAAAAARAALLAWVKQHVDVEVATPADPPAFLSLLVKYMGPDPAATVGLMVVLAMHEVSATTLSWVWHALAQHPEVADRLRDELRQTLGGRPPTVDDLPQLPYTEAVLAETRRLYPCVWSIVRFVREDVTLGGYPIPAGAVVMASAQAMHHDERFFPDPERFDPDRWAPGAAVIPEFAYFPFSEGARACAGGEFARVQDALILATLAQQWRPALIPDQSIQPIPQKSNAPRGGIRMTLEPV